MKIDSLDKLGEKINLQQDQNGNLFITIQVYNKEDNTIKHVKVAKLNCIQSGVGYANNIVMPLTQHKQFHEIIKAQNLKQNMKNLYKLLLKSL